MENVSENWYLVLYEFSFFSFSHNEKLLNSNEPHINLQILRH